MRFRSKKFMQEWNREMVNPDHIVDVGPPGDRVILRVQGSRRDLDLKNTEGLMLHCDRPRFMGEIWTLFRQRCSAA